MGDENKTGTEFGKKRLWKVTVVWNSCPEDSNAEQQRNMLGVMQRGGRETETFLSPV